MINNKNKNSLSLEQNNQSRKTTHDSKLSDCCNHGKTCHGNNLSDGMFSGKKDITSKNKNFSHQSPDNQEDNFHKNNDLKLPEDKKNSDLKNHEHFGHHTTDIGSEEDIALTSGSKKNKKNNHTT